MHPLPVSPDRFHHERQLLRLGWRRLAGIDEAGRGPLAGPVVAAAVILPSAWIETRLPPGLDGLNDSKQLSPRRRTRYHDTLISRPEVRYGLAIVEPAEIDQLNILRATHAAMVRAVTQLSPAPDHVLVDGLPVGALALPQTALVGGDGLSFSIAAASVLAKVTRDRLMVEQDARWPGYGFAVHKGYPTPQHLRALRDLGPSPIHRRSFAPVAASQLEFFGP